MEKKLNYCIHGFSINEYCPACELDLLQFAAWLGISAKYLDSFEIKSMMEVLN